MGARETNTDELVKLIAQKLKVMPELAAPTWAMFVKTGSFRQRKPANPDWWFVRAASMLRRIYVQGPVGVSRLRTVYGGSKRRGAKPRIQARASGAIIRRILHQLEKAGLVKSVEKRGRFITPKGQKMLDQAAKELKK